MQRQRLAWSATDSTVAVEIRNYPFTLSVFFSDKVNSQQVSSDNRSNRTLSHLNDNDGRKRRNEKGVCVSVRYMIAWTEYILKWVSE